MLIKCSNTNLLGHNFTPLVVAYFFQLISYAPLVPLTAMGEMDMDDQCISSLYELHFPCDSSVMLLTDKFIAPRVTNLCAFLKASKFVIETKDNGEGIGNTIMDFAYSHCQVTWTSI